MSFALPLDNMTTEEKLRMMERIWDDLCKNVEEIPSPAWHTPILSQRESAIQQDEEQIDDWEDAKKRIRKSLP